MAGCHVPTQVTLIIPLPQLNKGEKKIKRPSQIEIRVGRDHSAVTVMGKTRLDLGKLIYYQSHQSRVMRNKTKS